MPGNKYHERGVAHRARVAGLVPWAAFACCLAALLAVGYYEVSARKIQARLDAALAAEQARLRLDICIEQRANALAHTAMRWPERFIQIPTALHSRAREIMAWFPGVVEVAVVDFAGIVVAVVPPEDGAPTHFVRGGIAALPPEVPGAAEGPRALGPLEAAPPELELLAWPTRWPGTQPDGWLYAIVDMEAVVNACVRDQRLGVDFALILRDAAGRLRHATHPIPAAASDFMHVVPQRVLDTHWSWTAYPAPDRPPRDRRNGLILLPVVALLVALGIALLVRSMPRQAEALRRSEQRMRRLIDLLPHVIYAVGADARILFANQACADAFGRDVETLAGRGLAHLGMPAAQAAAMAQADARVLAERVGAYTPCQAITDHKGRERLFEVARIPVPGRGGEEEAVLVVATDITDRVRVEGELTQYRTQLEELVRDRTAALESAQRDLVRSAKMATLGQLMATVSHELRNPLGTIATALYTIARHEQVSGAPGVDAAIGRAERNIRRCEVIIDELIDFARVHPPRVQRMPFDPWLRRIVEAYAWPESVGHELRLGANAAPAFDPERLRRVVINLLDNACHAIAEARVDDPKHPGRVSIESSVGNDGLRCVIRDTGPGIVDEDHERIFEPLYSTRSFGLGLGLAIVRQVVEQHRGEVWLERGMPGGTVAVFRLPLGDDSEQPS